MDLRENPEYLEYIYKNSNDYVEELFKQKFPNISFEKLELLYKDTITLDGCTRYVEPGFDKIYTWNSLKQEWK